MDQCPGRDKGLNAQYWGTSLTQPKDVFWLLCKFRIDHKSVPKRMIDDDETNRSNPTQPNPPGAAPRHATHSLAVTFARHRHQGRPVIPVLRPGPRGARKRARLRGPRAFFGESAARARGARDRNELLQDGRQGGQPRGAAGGGDARVVAVLEWAHAVDAGAGLHCAQLGHCFRGRDEGLLPRRVDIRRGLFVLFCFPFPFVQEAELFIFHFFLLIGPHEFRRVR